MVQLRGAGLASKQWLVGRGTWCTQGTGLATLCLSCWGCAPGLLCTAGPPRATWAKCVALGSCGSSACCQDLQCPSPCQPMRPQWRGCTCQCTWGTMPQHSATGGAAKMTFGHFDHMMVIYHATKISRINYYKALNHLAHLPAGTPAMVVLTSAGPWGTLSSATHHFGGPPSPPNPS